MERRDLLMLAGAILVGAIAGALVGGLVALATGFGYATAFGGVAGSYLGIIYADWHWGPKSRRVRVKRAEEERRRVAQAERESRKAAMAAGRSTHSHGRPAKKAAARAKH